MNQRRRLRLVIGSLLLLSVSGALIRAADLAFNAQLVGQLDPFPGNNWYSNVWGEGNLAFLGSYSGSGVGIVDITTPSSPSLLAHYNPATGGKFVDVKVRGSRGYFASDNGGGVHIVDLTNPASPSLINRITKADGGSNSIHNIFVDGDFLYEADFSTNIVKVFDISGVTPTTRATMVANITTTDPKQIHDVTVVNGRLYTSGWGGKTDIFDVTTPSSPVLLGSINSGDKSHSNWATSDNGLLVSARETSNGDVRIYDVSTPASPVLLSTITGATLGIDAVSPHNPVVVDDYLFVSWYEAGLQVLDISDPSNPAHVAAYDTLSVPHDVYEGNWGVYPFVGFDKILLSDLDHGLFEVDVSDIVPVTLSADFNADGVVNAADYVVWRIHNGTAFDLPNRDPNESGNVGQGDYQVWVNNFGRASGSGNSLDSQSPVPEPASWLLIMAGLTLAWSGRGRSGPFSCAGYVRSCRI